MKKSLIQFIYYLIYFDKYFMEIYKIYLTNKTRFFQHPAPIQIDWKMFVDLKPFLFSCKKNI